MITRKRTLCPTLSKDDALSEEASKTVKQRPSNNGKQKVSKFSSKMKQTCDKILFVKEAYKMKKGSTSTKSAATKQPMQSSSTITKDISNDESNAQSESLEHPNTQHGIAIDHEIDESSSGDIPVPKPSTIANLFDLVPSSVYTSTDTISTDASALDGSSMVAAAAEILKEQEKAICEFVSTTSINSQQFNTTPQSIIKTINQLSKQNEDILAENLPNTSIDDMNVGENVLLEAPSSSMHGNADDETADESFDEDVDLCDKLLETDGETKGHIDPNITEALKVAMQPGSQISSKDIANYLKMLGQENLLASFQGKEPESNQKPKRRKQSTSESSEITRVRIAESLLLLGDSNKQRFCVGCKKRVEGDCIVHGNAMMSLKATKAVETLPKTMTIQKSMIPKSGLGVFSLVEVDVGTVLGPMEGEVLREKPTKHHANSFVWEVYEDDQETVSHYVDCGNQEKSNWMRFINCARFEEEQNLIAEQRDKQIFFRTYKKISPGDEFLVWYGSTLESVSQSLLSMDSDHKETSATQEADDEEKANEEMENDLLADKFQCKMCKSMFSSEYYLTRHRTYACPESTKFHCEECDTVFKNMDNFKRHKRRGCSVEKSFKCVLCSAIFTQKANLKVHLKTHFNIREFKCPYCGRSFSRNTFLKNHILSVHEKEKPFVCADCGKTFSRMDSMKRHASLHQERKAECEHCGMTYHTVNNLNMHIKRSHTDNPDMLTDQCRICSTVYKDIKSHMFFMHQKKAMAKCNICNKYFRNMGNHMRSHDQKESKQQRCSICDKSFVCLNRHMLVHAAKGDSQAVSIIENIIGEIKEEKAEENVKKDDHTVSDK